MQRATRIAASVVGIYAGVLGAIHGYYEFLQGNIATNNIIISARGAPCQPEAVSHACWPAMTLVPNFQVSGVLAIIVSLAALVWAVAFIKRQRGSLVMFLLALLMLLVGGGFLPPFYGMIAAAAGSRINAPLSWWRKRLPERVLHTLAGLWPWPLVIYLLWVVTQSLLGSALNTFLMRVGGILLPLEIGMLLLGVVTAFAHDIKTKPVAMQTQATHRYSKDSLS